MRREFDTTDRLLCGFEFDTPHWTLMLNNPPIRKDGAPSTEEQRKAGRGKSSRCMSKSVTGASHQINMCLFSKLTHSVFYFFSWVLDGYRDHWLPLQGCFTKSLISKHVQSYLYRWKKSCAQMFSGVRLCVIPWTVGPDKRAIFYAKPASTLY